MDEEMKNAEQAGNEMKNEAGSIFDQVKEMLGDAANDGAGVFDKLKGLFEGKEGDPSIFEKAKEMFDGKEGEPGMLDQLKEMLDKGTTAAGEMSQDFLEKAKAMFETKEGEPSLLDKAKEMFGEGATAAGEMMDKAKDFVEKGSAAATEVAQDLSQKAKDAFEPKEGEESVIDKAKDCRPIEWGADIVTHSTTKYMDGHGAAVGGCIVDSGKFDWMAHADKFPGLCTPDDSYHGITYAEKFGNAGAFITKATAQLMRDFGSIQSPQNAFLLNLGLESLHVRMPRHVENGQAVAEFLEKHPKVEKVSYSGLKSDKYYALAQKYLPNGGCGVVSFVIKGGRPAAEAFMKKLRLAAIETHVADARTCCLNPATSTHRQMTDEQLEAAGIPAGLVRMSCGLEDKEDLIADIKQALD